LTTAKIDKETDSRFRVSGDMTFATTRELLAESKALFRKNENLNLNLAGVTHADSAGLALLLEWIAEAEKAGGEISIEDMPDSLLAIARLCRMEETLNAVAHKPHK
jgi:phospholipid transport system transporter-binding protein